ncbi:MAG: hypothetical protein AB8G96_15235 [Phycisphaerales bacterium]
MVLSKDQAMSNGLFCFSAELNFYFDEPAMVPGEDGEPIGPVVGYGRALLITSSGLVPAMQMIEEIITAARTEASDDDSEMGSLEAVEIALLDPEAVDRSEIEGNLEDAGVHFVTDPMFILLEDEIEDFGDEAAEGSDD